MKFGSRWTAIAGVSTVLVGTSAFAADLPARPMVPPTPAFTWTGFYSGIGIGGISEEFGRPTLSTPAFTDIGGVVTPAAAIPFGFGNGFGGNGRRSDGSPLVASRGGYLHQFGTIVLGIETDTQLYSVTRRARPITAAQAAAVALPAPFLPTNDYALHSGTQSSVRGRVGVTWDRFMLYATGGVSWADVKVSANYAPSFVVIGGIVAAPVVFPVPGNTFSKTRTVSGWTAGIGGEWAITDATSIGIEYRHSEYDNESRSAGGIPFITPAGTVGFVPVAARTDFSNDVVMFTYNVRFGRIFPQLDWRL